MAGNYIIEDIYQGGYSSLNPESGSEFFTGYRMPAGSLGISTDPRTANILKEFADKIAPGIKGVELSLIQPEILEAIPKQHLKEINRMAKLTGVEVTMHGPLIDASGIGERGFDDSQREIAERKIFQAVEKSHELNPKGNIPVTFHTANQLPATRYSKKEGEEQITEIMPVVNQETGELTIVKREMKISPKLTEDDKIKEEMWEVDKKIKSMNETQWNDKLQRLIIPKEHADAILRETAPYAIPIYQKLQEIKSEEMQKEYLDKHPTQQQILSRFKNAHEQLEEIKGHLDSSFERVYKYTKKENKEYVKKYLKEVIKTFENTLKKDDIMSSSKALQGIMEDLRVEKGKLLEAPEVFKSADDYALEKSHETFGNVAWESYKKFGKKSPIISIENPPANMGLSRAKDLKDMVEGAREQFVKNATENGMSKNAAEKEAEKLIGVTWDVGHINQLRQFGFSGKDIIKEAEKIAPLVKHMHFSDNFGMENTELPMGMGNVDLKEVMRKLGKKGEEARKIIEAHHWWQFQQTSPVGVSMEAVGSPIYSMKMSPYWNQIAGFQEGYFGGYGTIFPPINYETFGTSFSTLPAELGGQRPGSGRGRMSGTPME